MPVAGPRKLNDLLDAVVSVGAGLELGATLFRITELAADLAGARYAALGVLDDEQAELVEFITVGLDERTRAEIGELPKGHGILGLLIDEATPLRLADLSEHPASYGFPPGHPPMRSFLGVPIRVRGQVFGNLYLTEKIGDEAFTDVDQELVVGLAAAAGVAIENARLHERVADLALIEDRDRIARDLHDTVIQRLFAIGMSLQSTASLIANDPEVATSRLDAAVDDLDQTVKQIRTSIFALDASRVGGEGVRDRVLRLCRESVGALGFHPQLSFVGAVDAAVPDGVISDLLSTLREALSNVARHARASEVVIELEASDAEIILRVVDDGLGLDSLERDEGNGLSNMAARASGHGGRLELDTGPPVGTSLVWRVPVASG